MKNGGPGPANEEVLLQWLMQCREPSVQHLTDSTFEHLTQVIFCDYDDNDDDDGRDDINFQASTGATTGDWFVLFFTDECEACRLTTIIFATSSIFFCQENGGGF